MWDVGHGDVAFTIDLRFHRFCLTSLLPMALAVQNYPRNIATVCLPNRSHFSNSLGRHTDRRWICEQTNKKNEGMSLPERVVVPIEFLEMIVLFRQNCSSALKKVQ